MLELSLSGCLVQMDIYGKRFLNHRWNEKFIRANKKKHSYSDYGDEKIEKNQALDMVCGEHITNRKYGKKYSMTFLCRRAMEENWKIH